MKIVFSTKNVNRGSFLDVCRYAYDYGFEGFEIFDAIKERSQHHDSILRRERVSDAKRKLVNRNISVAALRMPNPVESDETTSEAITKYVDMAANSGIENVIVRVEEKTSFDVLKQKLSDAVKRAEKSDVQILFETVAQERAAERVHRSGEHHAKDGDLEVDLSVEDHPQCKQQQKHFVSLPSQNFRAESDVPSQLSILNRKKRRNHAISLSLYARVHSLSIFAGKGLKFNGFQAL
jgi:sugar phosphate isomerase/epimerase